jgi:recombination protein RecR
MNNTEKLAELFREFPGIGPRQAKRFVYFLLNRSNGYSAELARLISEIKKEVQVCNTCFRFFNKNNSQSTTCNICSDEKRDKKLLMLVAHDSDLENIEKTGSFNGYYFVLGGTVPILEKNPERKFRQKELLDSVSKRAENALAEIIIALSYNPEGENTFSYLSSLLRPVTQNKNIKVSTLGRGLSTGTELEYSDPETLQSALANRK